jgi:anti-sigma B factor antagonist
MEIAVDKMDGLAVAVVPVDELDASNAGEFERDIAPILQANSKLVLDLSRLSFVDSSGLSAMLSCFRQLSARSGDLKLCGVSKRTRTASRPSPSLRRTRSDWDRLYRPAGRTRAAGPEQAQSRPQSCARRERSGGSPRISPAGLLRSIATAPAETRPAARRAKSFEP